MAVFAEERPGPTLVELLPAPDPAPLGLAAFALTTFMLSGHNASFIPDILWVGLALFYGGLVQLLAGMWEFRNRTSSARGRSRPTAGSGSRSEPSSYWPRRRSSAAR